MVMDPNREMRGKGTGGAALCPTGLPIRVKSLWRVGAGCPVPTLGQGRGSGKAWEISPKPAPNLLDFLQDAFYLRPS